MAALVNALARSSSSISRLEEPPGAPLETGSPPPDRPPVEDGGVSWGGRFMKSGDRPSRFKFLEKITKKLLFLAYEQKLNGRLTQEWKGLSDDH